MSNKRTRARTHTHDQLLLYIGAISNRISIFLYEEKSTKLRYENVRVREI